MNAALLLHRLHIMALLAVAPARLFHRLGQLDWYRQTLEGWIDPLLDRESPTVLDVGCATGTLCAQLQQSGCSVIGVDRSERMIRAGQHHFVGLDLRVADATALPFADGTFSLVASASLINIIDAPTKLLEEMVRVCQPGGWVTVLFPVEGFREECLTEVVDTWGMSGFSRAALETWQRSAPKLPVEQVGAWFEECSLKPEEPRFALAGMVASICARKGAM